MISELIDLLHIPDLILKLDCIQFYRSYFP